MTETAGVLMVCDSGPAIGIGHVMRCLALGEELASRGLAVTFVADLEQTPWAAAQVAARGMAVSPTPAGVDPVEWIRRQVATLRPQVLVVDSYRLPVEAYARLVDDSVPERPAPVLLALTDGDPGGRFADVYLDQNIGAETDLWELPAQCVRLAGLDYALMRSDLLARRPLLPNGDPEADPLRVLAFFGGTDAFGVAPAMTACLAATGMPWRATVVAAGPELAARAAAVPTLPGQLVEVVGPTDHLADLVAAADLVVSAAGTSSWELCCLGAAATLVCVADNQRESYGRALAAGLAFGLGDLEVLRRTPEVVTEELRVVLGSAERRAELRSRGWNHVDGNGRGRVADVVLDKYASRVASTRGAL